jgi:hypothetical protein
MTYRTASHLMVEVERILLTKWDPVGVKGNPMAEGNYCRYAGTVTKMLVSGSTAEAVADYLRRVETEWLKIGPDAGRCETAATECRLLLL